MNNSAMCSVVHSLHFFLSFIFTELNSSVAAPSKNKKLKPNSIDDIRQIDSQKEGFNAKMENFIPYARLKPIATTGMQLTNVKRKEAEPNLCVDTVNVVSSKKIAKHALNQQFQHLSSESEIEFPPTKMSKKQLKVAQEQLKKLTKINIHLSGKLKSIFFCSNFNFLNKSREGKYFNFFF